MKRYFKALGISFRSSHVEQTYRNAFGLKKSKSIDWLKLNVSLEWRRWR